MREIQCTTAPEATDLVARAEIHAREIRIPPCPEVLARFASEMNAPQPDLRRLSALIGCDVALSAALMKTVNAPFYRLATKATSVQQVLSILGLRASANLISGLMLRRAFAAGSGALMGRFWTRTAALAQAAPALASRLSGVAAEDAHTYMLFRDCGAAAMIGQFADYGEIFESFTRHPAPRVIAHELARYRYHHARVGCALTRSWLLPDPLCLAILHHHEVEPPEGGLAEDAHAVRRLVAFGLLADQIAALRAGAGLCPEWLSREGFVLETLRISADDVVALVGDASPDAYAAGARAA